MDACAWPVCNVTKNMIREIKPIENHFAVLSSQIILEKTLQSMGVNSKLGRRLRLLSFMPVRIALQSPQQYKFLVGVYAESLVTLRLWQESKKLCELSSVVPAIG